LCEEQKEQDPEELREDDLVMPCSALLVSNEGPVTHICLFDHSDSPVLRCSTIPEWNEGPSMNNLPGSDPFLPIHPVGGLLSGEQELTAEESQEGGSGAQSYNIHRLIVQGPDNGSTEFNKNLTLGHDSSTPILESIALWFSNQKFFRGISVGGNNSLTNPSKKNSELDELTKTAAFHLHAKAFLSFLVILQQQLGLLLPTWKRRYPGFALIALWWCQFARLAVIIKKLVLSCIKLLQLQPLLFSLSLAKHKGKFCIVLGLLFVGFVLLAWPRQEKTPEWSIGEGYEIAMDIYHDNVPFF